MCQNSWRRAIKEDLINWKKRFISFVFCQKKKEKERKRKKKEKKERKLTKRKEEQKYLIEEQNGSYERLFGKN